MVTLSGGNQQKAIVGRWLQREPAVCILDEPTKGVDIGARAALHRLILARAAQGIGDPADQLGSCPSCSGWPTACWCCTRAGSSAELAARRGRRRSASWNWPRRDAPHDHAARCRASATQELSLAAVIVLVCIGFSLLSGRFADLDNLRNVAAAGAPTVIAAVGMTFVIATRGIDLSIGSILNLALCAAVTLTGTRIEAELSTRTTWLVYPMALATGLVARRAQRAAHHPPAAEPAHRHARAR